MTVLSAVETDSSLPVVAHFGQDSLPQGHDSLPHGGACCAMGGCMIRRSIWTITAVIAMFAAVVLGFLLGSTKPTQATRWQIPATIDASTAVSGEKYSMATGPVGDDAEGLFVLDHNSGLLQCSVMYPRMGQFLGLFSVNVSDTLGAGAKGGSYLMVTGLADFPRASNREIGANMLVYVLNTATGNYAAYAVPFDRTASTAGRPQQGLMIPMGTGQANPAPVRDAGR